MCNYSANSVAYVTPFVQIIDFGLADFREVFGAGYVTGKRTLIHNEPHHAESNLHADSKTQGNGQQEEVHGKGQEGRRVPIRGNKGIAKRSDAVPSGHKATKFFPTPSNLLPQVSFLAKYLVCPPPGSHPGPDSLPIAAPFSHSCLDFTLHVDSAVC